MTDGVCAEEAIEVVLMRVAVGRNDVAAVKVDRGVGTALVGMMSQGAAFDVEVVLDECRSVEPEAVDEVGHGALVRH